jgi:hypothetical protein
MHGVAYTPPIFKSYDDFTSILFVNAHRIHNMLMMQSIVLTDLVTTNKRADPSGRAI